MRATVEGSIGKGSNINVRILLSTVSGIPLGPWVQNVRSLCLCGLLGPEAHPSANGTPLIVIAKGSLVVIYGPRAYTRGAYPDQQGLIGPSRP